jgi:hypothetical protein
MSPSSGGAYPVDGGSPYLRGCSCVLNKSKEMNNIQKQNIYINVPSSKTFRSCKITDVSVRVGGTKC